MKSNELKTFVLEQIDFKNIEIDNKLFEEINQNEKIDVSIEFNDIKKWHLHPITHASNLLEDIFISLWFKIEDWPQVEIEEYNFDKLNIPDNHPARDVWDTFWIDDEINKARKTDKNIYLELTLHQFK